MACCATVRLDIQPGSMQGGERCFERKSRLHMPTHCRPKTSVPRIEHLKPTHSTNAAVQGRSLGRTHPHIHSLFFPEARKCLHPRCQLSWCSPERGGTREREDRVLRRRRAKHAPLATRGSASSRASCGRTTSSCPAEQLMLWLNNHIQCPMQASATPTGANLDATSSRGSV